MGSTPLRLITEYDNIFDSTFSSMLILIIKYQSAFFRIKTLICILNISRENFDVCDKHNFLKSD